jgi:hypothetical protein
MRTDVTCRKAKALKVADGAPSCAEQAAKHTAFIRDCNNCIMQLERSLTDANQDEVTVPVKSDPSVNSSVCVPSSLKKACGLHCICAGLA